MDDRPSDLTEADVEAAMRDLDAFVDITPEDLLDVYARAREHALRRRPPQRPPSPAAAAPTGYLAKMRGGGHVPPGESLREVAWSLAGALLGIGACALLSARLFEPRDLTLLIGSFGASAVLVYAAIKSPLAQPRNLVGGHLVSALVGVSCWKAFGPTPWLAAALGVSLAIAAMLLTRTLHPPGGATALIAVIGGPKVHALGYLYVIVPAALGALVLLAVALAVNNLSPHRRYPEYWW
jgi:CBS-domain-containing membrane protein